MLGTDVILALKDGLNFFISRLPLRRSSKLEEEVLRVEKSSIEMEWPVCLWCAKTLEYEV